VPKNKKITAPKKNLRLKKISEGSFWELRFPKKKNAVLKILKLHKNKIKFSELTLNKANQNLSVFYHLCMLGQ
jgi:hypothetical protein